MMIAGDPFMDEGAREELRRRLEKALTELGAQIERLRLKYRNMEAMSREYMEKVVESLIVKDEAKATIYAEEIAEIRRLAEIVYKTQLVLEQVKLRLETIIEISELIGLVVPLVSLITEIEDEVAGIAPEAMDNLRELASCIEEFTSTAAAKEMEPIRKEELSDEALKVLDEARKIAAEKVEETFPDVPELTEKERLIYTYISRNGEEIDVYKCADELGIGVEEVKAVLEELERKGLIELVGEGEAG